MYTYGTVLSHNIVSYYNEVTKTDFNTILELCAHCTCRKRHSKEMHTTYHK